MGKDCPGSGGIGDRRHQQLGVEELLAAPRDEKVVAAVSHLQRYQGHCFFSDPVGTASEDERFEVSGRSVGKAAHTCRIRNLGSLLVESPPKKR